MVRGLGGLLWLEKTMTSAIQWVSPRHESRPTSSDVMNNVDAWAPVGTQGQVLQPTGSPWLGMRRGGAVHRSAAAERADAARAACCVLRAARAWGVAAAAAALNEVAGDLWAFAASERRVFDCDDKTWVFVNIACMFVNIACLHNIVSQFTARWVGRRVWYLALFVY